MKNMKTLAFFCHMNKRRNTLSFSQSMCITHPFCTNKSLQGTDQGEQTYLDSSVMFNDDKSNQQHSKRQSILTKRHRISFFCLQQNNKLIISFRFPFKLSLKSPQTLLSFSSHSMYLLFSPVPMATCQIQKNFCSSKENIL